MKHTPEPWGLDEFGDISAGHVMICQSADLNFDNEADIHRIVACINGCKNINPQGIPAALEALRILTLERHRFTASREDADTCHYCGGNFRSEDHFREGESRAKDLDNARQALAALEMKEDSV